jgi:hypothetical protein
MKPLAALFPLGPIVVSRQCHVAWLSASKESMDTCCCIPVSRWQWARSNSSVNELLQRRELDDAKYTGSIPSKPLKLPVSLRCHWKIPFPFSTLILTFFTWNCGPFSGSQARWTRWICSSTYVKGRLNRQPPWHETRWTRTWTPWRDPWILLVAKSWYTWPNIASWEKKEEQE